MLYKGGLIAEALFGETDMTAFGFHNPKHTDFGAAGDGVADDRASLNAVDTEMKTNGGLAVVDHGTYKLSSNLTLQENTGWMMQPGAMFSPDTGKALTVNASILAGAWQIFSGLGTVTGKMGNEEVLASWWGLKCDSSPTGGGTIETALLQKVLDYCSTNNAVLRLLPGQYVRIDGPINFYAGACIVGSGRTVCGVVLDSDPEVTWGSGFSQKIVNVGLTGIPSAIDGTDAQAPNDWVGVCRDVSFHVTSQGPDNCGLIDIAAIDGGMFHTCLFDFRDRGNGKDGPTFVSLGSTSWHSDPYRDRKRGVMINNHHLMNANSPAHVDGASPGGINLTFAKHWRFFGEYITKTGDDALVVIGDGSEDNVAIGCHCESVYGRTGSIGGARNIFIGCYHGHLPGDDAVWSAANGFVTIQTSTVGKQTKDSGFVSCTYKLPNGPGALTYGAINLDGSIDCFAKNCTVWNDDTSATVQCTSSVFILAGWTDPEGVEDPHVSLPGNPDIMRSTGHLWAGNRAQGAGTVRLQEGGLDAATDVFRITMVDNAFDVYSTTGLMSSFSASNRQRGKAVLAEATHLGVHGYAFTDQVLLGEFLASTVGVGATNAVVQGGYTRIYPANGPFILTTIEATADAAPTGDTITCQVKKNGAAITSYAAVISAAANAGEKDSRALAGRNIAAGDYLEVDATGGGSLGNTPDVLIRLYGVRML